MVSVCVTQSKYEDIGLMQTAADDLDESVFFLHEQRLNAIYSNCGYVELQLMRSLFDFNNIILSRLYKKKRLKTTLTESEKVTAEEYMICSEATF